MTALKDWSIIYTKGNAGSVVGLFGKTCTANADVGFVARAVEQSRVRSGDFDHAPFKPGASPPTSSRPVPPAPRRGLQTSAMSSRRRNEATYVDEASAPSRCALPSLGFPTSLTPLARADSPGRSNPATSTSSVASSGPPFQLTVRPGWTRATSIRYRRRRACSSRSRAPTWIWRAC